MVKAAQTGDLSQDENRDQMYAAFARAQFEMDLIKTMITEHKAGISRPWSDRKYIVEEEFS
jgi:hypothetical protein